MQPGYVSSMRANPGREQLQIDAEKIERPEQERNPVLDPERDQSDRRLFGGSKKLRASDRSVKSFEIC